MDIRRPNEVGTALHGPEGVEETDGTIAITNGVKHMIVGKMKLRRLKIFAKNHVRIAVSIMNLIQYIYNIRYQAFY